MLYSRRVDVEQIELLEKIREKKMKLDELVKDRSTLTEDIIVRTSEELDDLINEYYGG